VRLILCRGTGKIFISASLSFRNAVAPFFVSAVMLKLACSFKVLLEEKMIEFRVDSMTCGSCANAITKAVKSVDSDAQVQVEVKDKLVRVESNADVQHIKEAIHNAGYTTTSPDKAAEQVTPRGGCC
jgi:copper chaperone